MYHLKLHQAMSFVKSRQTSACLDFQVARNTGNEFRAGACNRSHDKPKTLLVMNPAYIGLQVKKPAGRLVW